VTLTVGDLEVAPTEISELAEVESLGGVFVSDGIDDVFVSIVVVAEVLSIPDLVSAFLFRGLGE